MEIIILEKIKNLGNIGERISVKNGYARNYLIPYGKAVVANEKNIEKFSQMRLVLEKNAEETLQVAQNKKIELEKINLLISAKTIDGNKLFGSIGISNILHALKEKGIEIKKSEISMPYGAIRNIGEHEVILLLHSDVTAKLKILILAETV